MQQAAPGSPLGTRAVALAALLVLGGCISSSAPARFYQLSPVDALVIAADAVGTVRIGRVTLPGYLDRPHFVTRASETRLELSEFDRWAEPLAENAERLLLRNLAASLPAMRVVARARAGVAEDWRVTVDVRRFECGPGPACLLDARWGLSARDEEPVLRDSVFRTTADALETGSQAAAMSALLADLSHEIAVSISERTR